MKIGTIGYGFIGKCMADIFVNLGEEFIGFYDPCVERSVAIEDILLNSDVIHIASPTPYHLIHAKMVHSI